MTIIILIVIMWKLLYLIYFVVLLLTPIILLCLPADFFDYGESICVSTILLDRECFACGLTRAIQHLIHFEFFNAYKFNK